jgi:hypothetical protein
MKIYTHSYVDLDAAFSASLVKLHNSDKKCTIEFVSADHDGVGLDTDSIIVDLEAGGKGLKGDKSAFSSYLNMYCKNTYKEAFTNLSRFIDAQDSTGDWSTGYEIYGEGMESIPTLQYLFNSLRSSYDDDKALVNFAHNVLIGELKNYKKYRKALVEAEEAEWVYNNIAITKGVETQTTGILFSKGADFVIYEDGNNLGVLRSKYLAEVNLGNKLKSELPSWFHHESGFLSSWGTRKAIKSTPPSISSEQLAGIIHTLF